MPTLELRNAVAFALVAKPFYKNFRPVRKVADGASTYSWGNILLLHDESAWFRNVGARIAQRGPVSPDKIDDTDDVEYVYDAIAIRVIE